MIAKDARLSIQKIPMECLYIKEIQPRYVDRLMHYVKLLEAHPEEYAGLLFVVPSDTYPGLYVLLDGHHRYMASLVTGRPDALCIVIEEVH